MITIMKTYNSPMLKVISIKRGDIVSTSGPYESNGEYGAGVNLAAPGQRGLFDPYDAGY